MLGRRRRRWWADLALDLAGRSPLHYAALAGDVRGVEALSTDGADTTAADPHGFAALHLAALVGAVEIALALMRYGASVDQVNVFGNTALGIAVFNSRGQGEMIELPRARGVDPLKPNASGSSPLDLARKIANYDVARYSADLP